MRVAIVSFRTHQYGGVERYAYELVNHLSRKAEVHLFTNKFEGETNAKVHLIPAVGKRDLFAVNSFMYFLHRSIRRESFDIIHSMGPLYLFPDVVTVHMCQKRLIQEPENFFEDFSPLRRSYWKFRTLIAANFQRLSFNNAKKVIAVSSLLAKELRMSYGIKAPVVIYPGVEERFFQRFDRATRDEKREKMGIDKNALVILFVGSQWVRKRLRYVIHALSFLSKETILLVVGSGDTRKYLSFARQHKVAQRILFLGFKKQITDYYVVSDMLVLPSLYEGFGYPVLESMAMGLPVIVSRYVGAAELIKDGETGYLINNIDSPEVISSKIRFLAGSERYTSFSRRVREKAKELIWEKKIEEILFLYDEVIKMKIFSVS